MPEGILNSAAACRANAAAATQADEHQALKRHSAWGRPGSAGNVKMLEVAEPDIGTG